MSTLLLFVAICSYCVRCVNTFARYSTYGRRWTSLQSSFSSDEDDLKVLYEKAQLEDAEWLRRVFDESPFPVPLIDSNIDTEKSRNQPSPQQQQSDDETSANVSDTIDMKEMQSLFALGYNPSDIDSIKESVLLVILDKAVNRPKKGLPQSWLKTSNIDNRRLAEMDRDASDRRVPMRSSTRKGLINGAAPNDGVGEAFAWTGRPPTEEELIESRRLREDSIRNRQRRVQNDVERNTRDRREWDDENNENDGPIPFWPDSNEFKNMLIDESQWRAGIIGDWAKPLIKSETKWRYKLYKSWLQFLDEGIGDGFDVVADGFEDYYGDIDGDNRDLDDEVIARNNAYPSSSAGANTNADSNNEDDRNQRRRSDADSVRMSKAAAYDRWVQSRVGSADDDWVDMSQEERRAKIEMRNVVALREQEESEEQYRNRRRNSERGGVRSSNRRDFDDDFEDDGDDSGYRGGSLDDRGSWLDDEDDFDRDENDVDSRRRYTSPQGRADNRVPLRRQSPGEAPSRSTRKIDSGMDINSEEEYKQAWLRSAERRPISPSQPPPPPSSRSNKQD